MSTDSQFEIVGTKLIKFIGDINTEVIRVPEGIEWIENNALSGLNVKEIYLPSTIRGINSEALANNKYLTTISEDNSLRYFYTNWIDNCPSLSRFIGKAYENRAYDNGMIYNNSYSFKKLVWCPHTFTGKLIIPDEIQTIKDEAFKQCSKITELVLSDNIKYIYDKPFIGLSSVKEITFGKNVKEISAKAFKPLKNLEKIIVHPDNTFYEVRNNALYETQTNKLIALPKAITGTYRISEDTNYISQYAFVSSKVTKMIVPKNVYLPDAVFMHCNKLKAIEFEDPDTKVELRYFSKMGKHKSPSLKVLRNIIPILKPQLLSNQLKQLLIDDIIKAVTSNKIDDEEWKSLWLDYFKRNKKTYIQRMTDYPALLKLMTENKLLTLKDVRELIELVKNNKDVELNSILLEYQNNNFSDTALMKQKEKELLADPYSVSNMNKVWSFRKEKDNSITLLSYKGKDPNIIVPHEIGGKSVKRIKEGCFSPRASRLNDDQIYFREFELLSVVIPDSVECVGDSLFTYCRSLLSVTFPSHMTIENLSYSSSSGLSVYKGMFSNCKNLTEITIPEGVTTLPKETFEYCQKLKKVHLPQSLTKLSHYSFLDCESLEEIEIPSNVQYLESCCFDNCISLKNVIMHEGLKKIDSHAFTHCNSLTELCIPASVHSLWYPIFYFQDKTHDITIKGIEGSECIKYAKEYGLKYEIVDNLDD